MIGVLMGRDAWLTCRQRRARAMGFSGLAPVKLDLIHGEVRFKRDHRAIV